MELFRKKLRKGCDLIYRGERVRRFLRHSLVYGQRPRWGPVSHDFGNGLYFSPELDYVKSYTGPGGYIQAVDWSGRGHNLNLKYFRRSDEDDEGEWERLVKSSICFDTKISWEAPSIFSLSAEWVRGWRVEMEVKAGRGVCTSLTIH